MHRSPALKQVSSTLSFAHTYKTGSLKRVLSQKSLCLLINRSARNPSCVTDVVRCVAPPFKTLYAALSHNKKATNSSSSSQLHYAAPATLFTEGGRGTPALARAAHRLSWSWSSSSPSASARRATLSKKALLDPPCTLMENAKVAR